MCEMTKKWRKKSEKAAGKLKVRGSGDGNRDTSNYAGKKFPSDG